MKKNTQHYSGIGGQAVLEGVMMKNGDKYAVSVRKADHSIETMTEEYKGILGGSKLMRIPFVRGVFIFIDSMILGMKSLNFSADLFEEEEEDGGSGNDKKAGLICGEGSDAAQGAAERKQNLHQAKESREEESQENNTQGNNIQKKNNQKKETLATAFITVLSFVIAIGLFFLLPYYISIFTERWIHSHLAVSIIEGVVRLVLFIGYIAAISLMKDIHRLFQYHGAEHKCINCIESGLPLTVENAAKSSRFHKRCGSSFIIFVLLVSIIVFFFIQTRSPVMRVVLRILLIPVISGISYELIRKAGTSSNPVITAVSKPGLWMQKLTTKDPDDSMLEVAIASVNAVYDWKDYLTREFGERFDSETDPEETGFDFRPEEGKISAMSPAEG